MINAKQAEAGAGMVASRVAPRDLDMKKLRRPQEVRFSQNKPTDCAISLLVNRLALDR